MLIHDGAREKIRINENDPNNRARNLHPASAMAGNGPNENAPIRLTISVERYIVSRFSLCLVSVNLVRVRSQGENGDEVGFSLSLCPDLRKSWRA